MNREKAANTGFVPRHERTSGTTGTTGTTGMGSTRRDFGVRCGRLSGAALLAVAACVASGALAACGSDDDDATGTGTGTGTPDGGGTVGTGKDAGTGTTSPDATTGAADTGTTTTPPVDSGRGTDSSTPSDGAAMDSATDAGVDAGTFCQQPAQTGLAFCADFDEATALSLDGGAEPGAPPDTFDSLGNPGGVSLSATQAVSAPDSLLTQLLSTDPNNRNAKAVKQVAPVAGITQAIYEFDLYIASVPTNTGMLATDWQFTDNDGFGFRLAIFGNATGFDHVEMQHNYVGGGPDVIVAIPGVAANAWNHFKMVTVYGAQSSDGGDGAAFQLYLNRSTTAAVDATYPAPFAKATETHIAVGIAYSFDPSKAWSLYYDNTTLKVQ